MTPLAQKFMGELMKSEGKRLLHARALTPGAPTLTAASLREFKFFDIRSVFGRFDADLTKSTFDTEELGPVFQEEYDALMQGKAEYAFMPAPWSWFEISDFAALVCTAIPHYGSAASLSTRAFGESPPINTQMVWIQMAMSHGPALIMTDIAGAFLRPDRTSFGLALNSYYFSRLSAPDVAPRLGKTITMFFGGSLVCVNSAKSCVRTERLPSEKDRVRAINGASLLGKFPLRAYTEIKLVPGETVIPDPQHSAATGERAQHFVRAHLRRYRSGKTVLVREHHRGNPALGMCQSRYTVQTGAEQGGVS